MHIHVYPHTYTRMRGSGIRRALTVWAYAAWSDRRSWDSKSIIMNTRALCTTVRLGSCEGGYKCIRWRIPRLYAQPLMYTPPVHASCILCTPSIYPSCVPLLYTPPVTPPLHPSCNPHIHPSFTPLLYTPPVYPSSIHLLYIPLLYTPPVTPPAHPSCTQLLYIPHAYKRINSNFSKISRS
jgi:hypothetical protein